jgi:hypothetical protein
MIGLGELGVFLEVEEDLGELGKRMDFLGESFDEV